MATTQQQPTVFSAQEAERFAALMAGFDIGNTSEAEAMSKGRLLRRMAEEKNIRLVDTFELPEIRQAIDEQLQPNRLPVPDVAALETELEELRGKLAIAVPKVTELAQSLEAVAREQKTEMLCAIGGMGVLGIIAFAFHSWFLFVVCVWLCGSGAWFWLKESK